MAESSREKFVRLAEKRVNNTIKAIKLIGNLSNKSNYSYSEADIDKIFSALNSELKICQAKFRNSTQEKNSSFSLND